MTSEPEQRCPKCGSGEILEVHYGLPLEPSDGTWATGGCCIPPSPGSDRVPGWACKSCEATWDGKGLTPLGWRPADGLFTIR